MSELKVEKQKKAVTPTEASSLRWPMWDFPLLPSNFFTMSPAALLRHLNVDMPREFGAWTPAIEVKKSNGNLLLTAEVPGLKPEDIKVSIAGNSLILEGERKHESEEKGEEFYRSERSYGSFYRSLALPEGAEPDKTKAELVNGVLHVSIPVTASTPVKEIPVAAS